ncbi:hypothetical protein WR25_03923 [Diploscapter pachys]|uniref:Uncharacterized protein n=1 Tax=Diploscapter pachys TaxID=2018661 RepID=A0A2A2J1Q6_9BILA|nr:hypothetical protein WR25_03923 [Diploscapter pachys]
MDYDIEDPIFDEEPHSKCDQERISISVLPRQGTFRKAIPCMPMYLASICCLCNVFIPGLEVENKEKRKRSRKVRLDV